VFDWTDPRIQGNRVLRPWSDGFDQAARRGLLVGVLVQRLHHQLRDRARPRYFGADPNALLTQNELDAAKLIHSDYLNAQDQQPLVWRRALPSPARMSISWRGPRAPAVRINVTRDALTRAERASGQARHDALSQLAARLNTDAQGSSDQAKVRVLIGAINDLNK